MGTRSSLHSVQLTCALCKSHCTHTLIPRGHELVSLGAVSRSVDDDEFAYARCTNGRCRVWNRYEIVKTPDRRAAA